MKFFSIFKNEKHITDWHNNWIKRLKKEKSSKEKISNKMKSKNPLVIPRNHLVEKAINKAVEKCDFSMVNDLVEVLKKPFESTKKVNLVEPPKPGEDIKNTFCGT